MGQDLIIISIQKSWHFVRETAGFAYGFIMISYIFQEVANGGMKGYEWSDKKRLLGGQETTVTIYTGTKIEYNEKHVNWLILIFK